MNVIRLCYIVLNTRLIKLGKKVETQTYIQRISLPYNKLKMNITREAFAKLCLDSPKHVNTYIHRGKVIADGDNIDINDPINKMHIEKRIAFHQKKSLKAESVSDDAWAPSTVEQYLKISDLPGKVSDINDDHGISHYIKKKIIGDANLVEVRVELEKQKLSKLMSKLLPADLVFSAQEIYELNILKSFEKGCENIAQMFCNKMAGGDNAMYKQALDELHGELHRCVRDAGKKILDDLEKMLEDHTDNRKTI